MPPKSPSPNKKKHQIQPDTNDQPLSKKAKIEQDIEQHTDVEMTTEDDKSSPKKIAEKPKKRKMRDETDAIDDELIAENEDDSYVSDPTSFEAKNFESIIINDYSNGKKLSNFLNKRTTTKSLGLELIYKDDSDSDKAFKNGMNIELVMRPSFGFLTPPLLNVNKVFVLM